MKDRWDGYIDSWTESSRLANYWRRFFNIEEVQGESTTGGHQELYHPDQSDNAAPGKQDEEDLADDTSVVWQTQERSHPQPDTSTGYHSLVLIADPDFNAPILEKLQIPPEDPSENPAKLFTAMELSHLSSHLAITASELARSAQPAEFADISDISD